MKLGKLLFLFLFFFLLSMYSSLAPILAQENWDLESIVPENRPQKIWPLRNHPEQNKGTLLKKGKDAFKARYHLIKRAQKSIWFKTFEFYGDESGQRLAARLIDRKQNSNLDIRVFVDSFPIWMEPSKILGRNTIIMLDNLMAAGIPVNGYLCGSPKQIYREVLQDFHFINNLNYRFHEKSMIIDYHFPHDTQKMAILGGINSTNQYFRIGLEKWFDVDLLVHGKIVDDVGESFLEDWNKYEDRGLSDRSCLNPYEVGTPHYRDFYEQRRQDYMVSDHPYSKANHLLAKLELDEIEADVERVNSLRTDPIEVKFLKSDPDPQYDSYDISSENVIEQAYIDLIDNSRKEILISNIYFIPSKKMIMALKNARLRGVNIKVVTNSIESNSQTSTVVLGRFYYEAVANPFVKTFNFKRAYKNMFSRSYRKEKRQWFSIPDKDKGWIKIYEFDGKKSREEEEREKLQRLDPESSVYEPRLSKVREIEHIENDFSIWQNFEGKIRIKVRDKLKSAINKIVRGKKKGITLLHSKFAIFDNKVFTIGSFNIDPRSRKLSREHALVVKSRPLIKDLRRYFNLQLKHAKLIDSKTMHAYRHPKNLFKKFDLWFIRLFEGQY